MLLAIDAGNTNTVFSVFDEGRERGSWRCATDARRTADEYAVWLSQLLFLNQMQPAQISDVIIGSVVPGATFNLRKLATRHFGREAMVVGDPGVKLGILVDVDRPAEVGADRMVNAVAARQAYPVPLIVVDFGTATTFDVVDRHGSYIGGVICPGVNLSLDALRMAAAKLPRVDVAKPPSVIGRDTVQAMQSGVYWGYVGLVEGLVRRIEAEYGERMHVIATGGLAVLFADAMPLIRAIDDDLTLRGLKMIHELNRAS